MKKIFSVLLLVLVFETIKAQTNIQIQYDWGRNIAYKEAQVTTTIEGSYFDNWGSTYFFGDIDVGYNTGIYGEFSRSFNFWQSSKFKDLSVQLEFDGGLYKGIFLNPAILAGLNYTFHNESYSNFIQVQILYKKIFNGVIYLGEDNILPGSSKCPMQFTLVWGCNDLFKVKGLNFLGFADFWWQDQELLCGNTSVVFMTEPQLWYNVGQYFSCTNLSVGGEIELAVNFDTNVAKHFTCYPSLGIKWIF